MAGKPVIAGEFPARRRVMQIDGEGIVEIEFQPAELLGPAGWTMRSPPSGVFTIL